MISEGLLKQEDLISKLGTPAQTKNLAKLLGPEWRGDYFSPNSLRAIVERGPFVAELRPWFREGERAQEAHAVVVDGLTQAGTLAIRDPAEGSRYEMTLEAFKHNWTYAAVFREKIK
ncbi:MAG: hypothetical protein KGS72_13050 [Cyanobacteria bacterium REEB67]|nr:hypothetical protein [Cyanobacteria bacterium REEB67]